LNYRILAAQFPGQASQSLISEIHGVPHFLRFTLAPRLRASVFDPVGFATSL
jgi:hypothetical protein